jgi:hypothetical protein
LGLTEEGCRAAAKRISVTILADRFAGKKRRPDSNRIISRVAEDAGNLTGALDLVDYPSLDSAQLSRLFEEQNKLQEALKASRATSRVLEMRHEVLSAILTGRR